MTVTTVLLESPVNHSTILHAYDELVLQAGKRILSPVTVFAGGNTQGVHSVLGLEKSSAAAVFQW